jgi:F0F1-type ATP synthase assembly protein I
MPTEDPGGNDTQRSLAEFQDRVTQAAPAAGASYSLIGSIILLGGIGYAVDRWQGTWPWFLVGGLFLGVAIGLYGLARTVWHK